MMSTKGSIPKDQLDIIYTGKLTMTAYRVLGRNNSQPPLSIITNDYMVS